MNSASQHDSSHYVTLGNSSSNTNVNNVNENAVHAAAVLHAHALLLQQQSGSTHSLTLLPSPASFSSTPSHFFSPATTTNTTTTNTTNTTNTTTIASSSVPRSSSFIMPSSSSASSASSSSNGVSTSAAAGSVPPLTGVAPGTFAATSALLSSSSAAASLSTYTAACARIDRRRDRYPFAIVWGPLPLITWLFPFIGHLGICDSAGRVHDFPGPYSIGLDDFMTPVYRFYTLDIDRVLAHIPREERVRAWDDAIGRSDDHFVHTMHNICCNNCHHHVALAFQCMGVDYMSTMLGVWWQIMLHGKYKSFGAFVSTWLPFAVILSVVLGCSIGLR